MNGRDPREGGRGQPEYGAEAEWDTWGMHQTICACLRQCCAIDAAAAARSLPLNDTPKIQALWCTMAIARVQASHLHIRAAALHAHQLNNVAAALATLAFGRTAFGWSASRRGAVDFPVMLQLNDVAAALAPSDRTGFG